MIELHKKSTYQNIYNEFSHYFIDTYCGFKLNGLTTEQALDAARICVQDKVADELVSNRLNRSILICAYNNLKTDTKLISKAVEYFQSMN